MSGFVSASGQVSFVLPCPRWTLRLHRDVGGAVHTAGEIIGFADRLAVLLHALDTPAHAAAARARNDWFLYVRCAAVAAGRDMFLCHDHVRAHRLTRSWAVGGIAGASRIVSSEADDLERENARLVTEVQPQLVQLPGVGPICAAQTFISWSHAGRLRSEDAFAMLAGAAPSQPLPA